MFSFFLARDEYTSIHEHIENWEKYYIALGVAVAAATALVAARSPRNARIWHFCVLTGLAMSAIGAIAFESDPRFCGRWDFLPYDGCQWALHYEESLEFLGIWLVLLGLLGQFSAASPSPNLRIRIALLLLSPLWILLLVLNALVPRLELALLAQPANVQFESGARLQGYRIDSGEESLALRVYVSSTAQEYFGLGYSIRLVDQVTGDFVADMEARADKPFGFLLAPDYNHLYGQAFELEIPPETPMSGALWIVLTLWREQDGEYLYEGLVASDHQLLADKQIVPGEVTLADE